MFIKCDRREGRGAAVKCFGEPEPLIGGKNIMCIHRNHIALKSINNQQISVFKAPQLAEKTQTMEEIQLFND